jgi:hypothetical protein
MNIIVEFYSLPDIIRAIGKKSIRFELKGGTLSDLIKELSKKIEAFAASIVVEDGRVDEIVQIYVNDHQHVPERDQEHFILKEGDKVSFMLMLEGG